MSATVCAAAQPPSGLELGESAAAQIQAGDVQGAARSAREALAADPGDTLLNNLAASILIVSGDTAGASSLWNAVLSDAPDDALAHYGLALASLSRGNAAGSAQHLGACRAGDRGVCLLAERYLEFLAGSGGAAGLTLPDPLASSARALSGMAALRAGDQTRAASDLAAAVSALGGDPYSELPAVLMTFDRRAPLRFGAPRLPTGNGLAPIRPRRGETVYSGTVTLSAGDGVPPGSFVAFRIDGRAASIANAPPYRMVWDTATAPNGLHRVEIVVSDQRGQEIGRANREMRTRNARAPRATATDAARAMRLRDTLWQILALRPSRLIVAYEAAQCARAAGDPAAATRLLWTAASVDPGFRDVRQQLVQAAARVGPALWRGSPSSAEVAITFDDGPKPGVTEQLLAVLAREGVRATFFVIGRHAAAYPELTARLAQAGMQVENHSYTHPNMTVLPRAEAERELVRTSAAVQAATGRPPRFFRPPGGNVDAGVSRAAALWGMSPCMWTLDGEALENGTAQRLVSYVVGRAAPGAIILLHNGRPTTVDALPGIISGLRQRGLRLVTVDELAGTRASIVRP